MCSLLVFTNRLERIQVFLLKTIKQEEKKAWTATALGFFFQMKWRLVEAEGWRDAHNKNNEYVIAYKAN